MTFVVGKKVSATGRVLVGHNEDDREPLYLKHAILPARDWPGGAVLPATAGSQFGDRPRNAIRGQAPKR